jgi:hypothetical protein
MCSHRARELGLSRKPLHTLRQRLQAHLNDTAPTEVMMGTAFEADELDQKAGKNSTPHRDAAAPPRWRANQRKGHGTFANDRPPILVVDDIEMFYNSKRLYSYLGDVSPNAYEASAKVA